MGRFPIPVQAKARSRPIRCMWDAMTTILPKQANTSPMSRQRTTPNSVLSSPRFYFLPPFPMSDSTKHDSKKDIESATPAQPSRPAKTSESSFSEPEDPKGM